MLEKPTSTPALKRAAEAIGIEPFLPEVGLTRKADPWSGARPWRKLAVDPLTFVKLSMQARERTKEKNCRDIVGAWRPDMLWVI